MKKWNLTNLLYNMDTSEVDLSFNTTLEDGTEITLYDGQQFVNKVVYKYTSWCMGSPGFFDTEGKTWIDVCDDIEKAIQMFIDMYTLWQNDKRNGFTKLYEALVSKYNPIWNVDGVTGTIYEDEHTGTDTNAKTGDDTSKLSGTDATASSGSDINTLSGRDVDTLSGTDTNRLSGTDSTLHSGTITNAKNVTKDDTTRTGSKTLQKVGPETTSHGVFTFDDDSGAKPSTVDELRYGIGNGDPRTDTETYNSVKDSHLYTDSNTQTNNNTDATTFGKQDATTYGKIDTMQYGKVDTLQHGKTDTTTYGKQDKMTYNSTNTETRDLYDKHIEMQIRQGNIGVTKTQELIESQIDLTARDSLIDYMIADFIHTNCIL